MPHRPRANADTLTCIEDVPLWAEQLPLMVCCFDRDLILRYANPAYAAWFGAAKTSLLGRPLSDLLPAPDWAQVQPRTERALAGEAQHYERRELREGAERWLQVRLLPVASRSGEGVCGLLCLMQDITRQYAQDPRLDLLRTSPGVTLWNLDLTTGLLHAEQNWLDPEHRLEPTTFSTADWLGHVLPEDRDTLQQALLRIAAPGAREATVETRFRRLDGSVIWTMNHGIVQQRGPGGVATRVFGLTWDITELRQTQHKLERSERRFRMLAELSSEWFWESDSRDVLTYISRSSRRAADSPLATLDLIGVNIFSLYPGQEFSPEWAQLRFLMDERRDVRDLIVPFRLTPDSALMWWRLDATALLDEQGQYLGYRGVMRDVTREHQAEEKLQLAAYRDPLTGLANRALFEKHVDDAAGVTPKGQRFAVLFINLDHFQQINDALGHAVGDQVLIETAKRLVLLTRPHNTAARFGGDEFLVLARDVGTAADAARLAAEFRQTLGAPIVLDNRQLQTGVSIGVALYPDHGTSTAELIRRADAAMHEAKSLGRNRVETFSTALQARLERRLRLEDELRRAIAQQSFEVHLQPIWCRRQSVLLGGEGSSAESLRKGYDICGFEALARWTRGNGERVPPGEFIPILTESGLLDDFGPVMLDLTLRAYTRLRNECRFNGTIAFNVSPHQLHMSTCVECILGALRTHQVPADRLVLEMTENVEIESNPELRAVFDGLRQHGVALSLDDFGIGYSNLGYLTHIPARQIKIDRVIAAGVSQDRYKAAIARAAITLARTLDLEVVAEGVETAADLLWMERAGCPMIQGWVFSPALNVQQAINLLREIGAQNAGD